MGFTSRTKSMAARAGVATLEKAALPMVLKRKARRTGRAESIQSQNEASGGFLAGLRRTAGMLPYPWEMTNDQIPMTNEIPSSNVLGPTRKLTFPPGTLGPYGKALYCSM